MWPPREPSSPFWRTLKEGPPEPEMSLSENEPKWKKAEFNRQNHLEKDVYWILEVGSNYAMKASFSLSNNEFLSYLIKWVMNNVFYILPGNRFHIFLRNHAQGNMFLRSTMLELTDICIC